MSRDSALAGLQGALGKSVLSCRACIGHQWCAIGWSLVYCRTLGNGVCGHGTVDLAGECAFGRFVHWLKGGLGDGTLTAENVTLLQNAPSDVLVINFWSPGAGPTALPLLVLFLWGIVLELYVLQQADFFSFSFI